MTRDEMERAYRLYLGAFNKGDLRKAADFYHPQLSCNGQPMNRDDFRANVLGDALEVMPDCRVVIECLLIDGDWLAARLEWSGTVVREWAGIKPSGCKIRFAEHAFYRLRDGLCTDVFSVVDLDAARAASAHSA